jgi:hypothetical protein
MRAEYHIVGGQLSQTGKNLLDAMTVRVGVQFVIASTASVTLEP